jgi:DNA repair protein RecN (Recombination protein N)
MLKSLHIKNIVLIEDLELDFKQGFSALTGETGAGKSIVLSALGLLLGKKADASILRFGSESGEVTGEFDVTPQIKAILQDNEIDADELVIRRKISADGKSKSFINDTSVTLKLLDEIGANLVEIHGQHDQSGLLDTAVQLEIIDKFAKVNLDGLAAAYQQWKAKEKELAERQKKIEDAKREEDYLRHVLEELSELNPQAGEEQELADKRREMMDYEKIARILSDVESELTGDRNVDSAIVNAQKSLNRANQTKFDKAIEHLEAASVALGEAFAEIERLQNDMDADPDKIANIEERLFRIRELARKYNTQPDQLADFMGEVAGKLSLIKNEESGIKQLTDQVKKLAAEYLAEAEKISEQRKKAAKILEQKLIAELKPLAMQGTKFEVGFAQVAPSSNGSDKVEFLASTNPGTPIAPLKGIASGGEISRFMLALKVVLLNASAAPTIIFDEIDTGTGGSIAAAIGERLAKLGSSLQVFVVTHLPQVAACAENHLKVSKKTVKGRNATTVEILSSEERKEELARMLAGSTITKEARAAAEKLLG